MIQVLYIPVLFVCMNGQCHFAQSTYYTTAAECRAVLEEQVKTVRALAIKGGGVITQLEGTCITLKNGML